MPSPNATPTPITPPRVPLVDPRTGYIDRAWYLFFLSLNNVATAVIDDSGLTFSSESIIASYEAALQALAQEVETQPLPVDLSAELTKQIEAAGLASYSAGLLSQVAEMQKQIEALTVLPPSLLGSVTSVGLSLPTEFTVTDSPVTSSGTLTATWVSQTAKYFFAAPNATSGTPSFRAIVASDIPALSYVSSVTGTSPVASSGGLTPAISLDSGYGDTQNPYAAKTANYVLAGPTSGASTAPTFRALVASDIPTLGYVTSVTGTSPVVSSGGTTPAISMPAATTSVSGYLTSTDWNTFNNKQPAGTYVTAVSVASSNGFAGTSSGGATPALTLTTSITGLLYGNGTALVAATISAPLSYSAGTLSIPVATASANGYLSSTDWTTFNNKGSGSVTSVSFTGGLITVANATTTPALTVAGTSGGIPYFSSGTTWASSAALTQYGVVYGGGAGATPVATAAGTTGQVLTATTGGAPTWAAPATSGTVTSVSVVSANGFAGTVATATTTPAITLTTSITGVLKGNGTAISAAVVNTDYFAPSAPVTKTADFTVAATEVWLINNKSGSTCTATLPAAASWSGRVLRFQNYQAQTLVSASSNVVPLAGGAAATSILLASAGDSATLVSDGSNWLMTQYIPNNILLLE